MKLIVVFRCRGAMSPRFFYVKFLYCAKIKCLCAIKMLPFRALREYAVSTIIFKGDSAHAFAVDSKKAVSVS